MSDDKLNNKPFWSKKWGKNKICGITLSRLRPGKYKNGISYVTKLPCNHMFWFKAIEQWLNTGENTCPLCRQEIKFIILS